MNIKWNEYTWYSKLLAVIFFILVLPVWTFYMGTRYEESKLLNELYQEPENVITTSTQQKIDYSSPELLLQRLEMTLKGPGCTQDLLEKKHYSGQCKKTADALAKIDRATFTRFEEHPYYYKDKNNVYIEISNIETWYLAALDADLSTFKTYGGSYWATDKNSIFYQDEKMTGGDPMTFTILNNSYAKDKYRAYYINVPYEGRDWITTIPGIDYETFRTLPSERSDYAIDKNSAYYDDKPIKGANSISFKLVEQIPQLSFDDTSLYLRTDRIFPSLNVSKMKVVYYGEIENEQDTYLISDGVTTLYIKAGDEEYYETEVSLYE